MACYLTPSAIHQFSPSPGSLLHGLLCEWLQGALYQGSVNGMTCKDCPHFRESDNAYGGRCIHPAALELMRAGTLSREAGTAPVFKGYCVPEKRHLTKS